MTMLNRDYSGDDLELGVDYKGYAPVQTGDYKYLALIFIQTPLAKRLAPFFLPAGNNTHTDPMRRLYYGYFVNDYQGPMASVIVTEQLFADLLVWKTRVTPNAPDCKNIGIERWDDCKHSPLVRDYPRPSLRERLAVMAFCAIIHPVYRKHPNRRDKTISELVSFLCSRGAQRTLIENAVTALISISGDSKKDLHMQTFHNAIAQTSPSIPRIALDTSIDVEGILGEEAIDELLGRIAR
jgi:hypothetical protein